MTKDRLCQRMGAGALAFAVGVRALAGFGPAAAEGLQSLAARPGVVRALLGLELGPLEQQLVLASSAEGTGDTALPEQAGSEAPAALEDSAPEEGQASEAAFAEAGLEAETDPPASTPDKEAETGPEQTLRDTAAPEPETSGVLEAPETEETCAAPGTEAASVDSEPLSDAVTRDPEDENVWVYLPGPGGAAGETAGAEGSTAAAGTLTGSFNNQTDYDPDLEALLAGPVSLAGDGSEGPRVLIVHTHGTESYTPGSGDDYEETDPFHTLEEDRNVTGLGTVLAETLQAAGIGVVHDRAYHDYPAYNGSYTRTAEDIRALLERYPSLQLVIDLHRDSVQAADGSWTATAADEAAGARLLLVVGTDAGGLENPDWENNLALALQVGARLGDGSLYRGVNLRTERFNQQLAPTLLAELGACGDTWTQAEITARALGTAVAEVLQGAS